MRAYLSQRFPIVSLGGPLLSGYACCYLLFGQVHGHNAVSWATLVGGLTVVLLALVRRIVDDIEDLPEDIRTGRLAVAEGGRRYRRGLILGGIAATAVVGVLNATCSPGLLAASVGLAAWIPMAVALRNKIASRTLKFVVIEICPAAVLLYGYAVWAEATHDSLEAIAVLAVVGLFWTTYQFWNFTRKIGAGGWPPWRLTFQEAKPALIVLLILAASFSVLIAHQANLRVGYSLYGLTLSMLFVVIILRWWSRLPAREPERIRASWGGMPFAVAVEAGVLLGVLAS